MIEQRFLGGDFDASGGSAGRNASKRSAAVQREKGTPLIDLLVNGNVVDEQQIAIALAAEAELPLAIRN